MRTDSQKQLLKPEVSTPGASSVDTMKAGRKSLHPLQIAAGDKENLVGAGRKLPVVGDTDSKAILINSKVSNACQSPKKEKKKSNKSQEKKTITAEDLTSEEGPSEQYWQILAETRRKALEKTLAENQQLHEILDQKNIELNKYKKLLDEAQEIIDTLNEVLSEMNDSGDEGAIHQL